MKTPRLTKQSTDNVRNALSYTLNEVNGRYWVAVHNVQGIPCQLHSGEGVMLYSSKLSALRALARINLALEERS